ncbi:MAG: UDP-N-acetylmuramoyl-L-alanyl-D-glutamate--2,6-diaminopimelate ligase [Pseudomonadota bacterium]
MNLQALASGLDGITLSAGAAQISIAGITADSRAVQPGWLFAAIPGTQVDGRTFIASAIQSGASALLVPEGTALPANIDAEIAIITASNVRRALAQLAAAFHAEQPRTIVAVTGTSGKTSVADFTRQIFAHAGARAASLGTLGLVKPDGSVYGGLTTPDPVSLAASLATLAGEGVTHLAFEASSHGLDQFRLDGVRLTAGAFTNLGRDHMDYHPSVEHYLDAKMRLFEALLVPGQHAVIEADDGVSAAVIARAQARGLNVMSVGKAGETLQLVASERHGFRQRLEVRYDGSTHAFDLPLIGTYQASNALVAAGLALATGLDPGTVFADLGRLRGVKGRLEVVAETRGGLAVVDYAHKPEALEAVLQALRPFVTGRLICVVGCGGDRDQGKRPLMGAIAARLADDVIITDDNPRTEDPAAIRAAMMAAAPDAREIGDRAEAIARGAHMLGEGDVLVVAGKGHEPGQIVGDQVLPFSDHEEIAKALVPSGGVTQQVRS